MRLSVNLGVLALVLACAACVTSHDDGANPVCACSDTSGADTSGTETGDTSDSDSDTDTAATETGDTARLP